MKWLNVAGLIFNLLGAGVIAVWSAPRFDCSPWGRKMQREAPGANTGGRQSADASSAQSSSERRSNES